MKPVTVALFVASSLTAAASARAENATRTPVRVDASSEVVLERIDEEGEPVVVCRAPCDQRLDPEAQYRIHGSGVRPSALFRVQPQATTIATKPKSSGSFNAGVVLVALSGAFMTGGAMAIALPVVLSHGGVDTQGQLLASAFLSTPLFATGLATGIPGTIMMVQNYQSGARPLPSRSGRGVTVPVVSLSF